MKREKRTNYNQDEYYEERMSVSADRIFSDEDPSINRYEEDHYGEPFDPSVYYGTKKPAKANLEAPKDPAFFSIFPGSDAKPNPQFETPYYELKNQEAPEPEAVPEPPKRIYEEPEFEFTQGLFDEYDSVPEEQAPVLPLILDDPAPEKAAEEAYAEPALEEAAPEAAAVPAADEEEEIPSALKTEEAGEEEAAVSLPEEEETSALIPESDEEDLFAVSDEEAYSYIDAPDPLREAYEASSNDDLSFTEDLFDEFDGQFKDYAEEPPEMPAFMEQEKRDLKGWFSEPTSSYSREEWNFSDKPALNPNQPKKRPERIRRFQDPENYHRKDRDDRYDDFYEDDPDYYEDYPEYEEYDEYDEKAVARSSRRKTGAIISLFITIILLIGLIVFIFLLK